MITREDTAQQLLSTLRQLGATVSIKADNLVIKAPKGIMTPALTAKIKSHKAELLDITRDQTLTISRGEMANTDDLIIPLNFVQKRFWAQEQLSSEGNVHWLKFAWELKGNVDPEQLATAIKSVAEKQRVLSGVLSSHQDEASLTLDGAEPSIEMMKASDQSDLEACIDAFYANQPPLESGPLFQALIITTPDGSILLVINVHHLVWDGGSVDVFWKELAEELQNTTRLKTISRPNLTTESMQRHLESDRSEGAKELINRLDRLPEYPSLPSDKQRPDVFDHKGATKRLTLDTDAVRLVHEIARKFRTTPFCIYGASWAAFLCRLADVDDIVVASPMSLREEVGATSSIGCFINTAHYRFRAGLDAVPSDWIADLKSQITATLEHPFTPFEDVTAIVDGRRDAAHTPLAQAMFDYQLKEMPPLGGGVEVVDLPIDNEFTPYELAAAVIDSADKTLLELQYAVSLYSDRQIDRIAQSFLEFHRRFLMEAINGAPTRVSEIALISGEMRKQIAGFSRSTTDQGLDFGGAGPIELIDSQSASKPDEISVKFEGRSYSYRWLTDESKRIARLLRDAGIGSGSIVGIMTTRSPTAIASCLAVWRVGAAYLPLDISYPADRLSFMVADSSASAVIVDDHDDAASLGSNDAQIVAVSALTGAPENASEATFKETAYDDSAPAYVIYTSGSTGQPKGVVNGFSQLTNFLSTMAKTPGLAENDTLLAVTTLSFDISILECFLPLCVGGTVSLASSDEVADPFTLIEKLKEDRVTVMQATPSTWRLLIDAGWEGDRSITALSGGEALDPTLADDLLRRTKSLWNMYGPTETTVWSSYSRVKAGDFISVGKPFGGNTFHILDRSREVRPVGVPGELWIGGTNVSKGYLERPELNAERFVTIGSSEEGRERCYKTGDIAVWTEDGDCRVLGRADSQIKLRGHRIELEEIDAGLHSIPDLVEGAAAIRQDAAGEAALAAFVVFRDGDDVPTASDLRRKLRTVLPSYMLPQYFQPLDALPRLPNGKLDRKSLPEIATVGIQHREKAPPSTPNEIAIAGVWQSVLGVDTVSVTDNFFELGGQSLQAAQMVSQLKREQGISIPLRAAIFETLEQLAASSTGGAAATKAS